MADANTAKIKAVRKWLKDIITELEQRTNTNEL
jgi:LysR family glycine cleavage system transcriptional activator